MKYLAFGLASLCVGLEVFADHQRGSRTFACCTGNLHGGSGTDITSREDTLHACLKSFVGFDHTDLVQFDGRTFQEFGIRLQPDKNDRR